MRKLLTSGMAVFAGMVSLPVGVSNQQIPSTPPPDYRHDARLKRLQKFFRKAGCPAQQYSAVFLAIGAPNTGRSLDPPPKISVQRDTTVAVTTPGA